VAFPRLSEEEKKKYMEMGMPRVGMKHYKRLYNRWYNHASLPASRILTNGTVMIGNRIGKLTASWGSDRRAT